MKAKPQKTIPRRTSSAGQKVMAPHVLGELLLIEYSLQENIRSIQAHATELVRRLDRIHAFLAECRTRLYPTAK